MLEIKNMRFAFVAINVENFDQIYAHLIPLLHDWIDRALGKFQYRGNSQIYKDLLLC